MGAQAKKNATMAANISSLAVAGKKAARELASKEFKKLGELRAAGAHVPADDATEEKADATEEKAPSTHGCYFKQPTAGNGKCKGPFTTWEPDAWGRDHAQSWASESKCLERKSPHDAYCGVTGTTWLFVPEQASNASTPEGEAATKDAEEKKADAEEKKAETPAAQNSTV